ncbi:hypothetical protein AC1031_018983 [Aphanomyces cochlioides]|nr:hypothetical protein AC1031_018983 [Aphanomyces cochlioides]
MARLSVEDPETNPIVNGTNQETEVTQDVPADVNSPIKEDEPRSVERFELESFTPFSSCHLWRLMSSFYDRQGVDSWAQGIVPHFITSNTFIAKRYAQVFQAYLRDAIAQLDPAEPLYIVELGTGSGKFSFYFLQWLYELHPILSFPIERIHYVMTDFTDSNLKFWQNHPALAPYVERGSLDFAIFDATQDTSLYLIHSKQTIVAQSLRNPICVIANYLFDTLHHELFRVEEGVLKQGFISVGSTRAEEKGSTVDKALINSNFIDPLDPEIIKRLSNFFRYDPISSDFYSNHHYNAILKWYNHYYGQDPATILVPIGALNAIERLKLLSQNQLLLISGDKGHTNPDHFRGLQDPHIAVHGSFSVMVNYHAIGIYVAHRGGFALHNPQEEASLKVSLFVLPSHVSEASEESLEQLSTSRSLAYPNLAHVYDDTLVSFGPNDFFVMQKSMKEDTKTPSLKGAIALLKLSFYDADLFYKFRDVFLDQSPSAPAKVKADVMASLKKVWSHYYQLDKEKDIAFEVGRVYYGMREYEEALHYYTLSLEELGKHHVTYHNMGLCFYSTRRYVEQQLACWSIMTFIDCPMLYDALKLRLS